MKSKHFSLIFLMAAVLGSVFFLAKPAHALTCASGETSMLVLIRDAEGNLIPNLNVAVHIETQNVDGARFLGTRLAHAKTNAGGQWQDCVATHPAYAVNVYQFNPALGNQTSWSESVAAEGGGLVARITVGSLRVQVQGGDGLALMNHPYELFAQQLDANGQILITSANRLGTKLTTGASGQSTLRLGPGVYLVRARGNLGHAFSLPNLTLGAGQSLTAPLRMSTLRVRILNGLDRAAPRYRFTVHRQSDVGQTLNGAAVFSGRVTTLGQRDLHLPPGTYVITAPGSFRGHSFRLWDQVVTNQQLTNGRLKLSGLRVAVIARPGEYAPDARFSLWTQQLTEKNQPTFGIRLVDDQKVGGTGFRDLYLIPGTYIVHRGRQRLQDVDVFERQFTRVDFPRTLLVRVSDEASVSTPLNNGRVSLRPTTFPSLAGLRGTKTALSKAYRLRGQLGTSVTLVFYLPVAQVQSRGLDTRKIRIAWLDEKKQWHLLGRYDRLRGQVAAQIKSRGLFVLVST